MPKVGLGGEVLVTARPVKAESMAGILGPWVQLKIFSSAFITAAAAAAAAACSFAGASWLKSCSAWELAEFQVAVRGLYNRL